MFKFPLTQLINKFGFYRPSIQKTEIDKQNMRSSVKKETKTLREDYNNKDDDLIPYPDNLFV
jgi:hypothetical protein